MIGATKNWEEMQGSAAGGGGPGGQGPSEPIWATGRSMQMARQLSLVEGQHGMAGGDRVGWRRGGGKPAAILPGRGWP